MDYKSALSIQTNAKHYRDAEAMWRQAVHFDTLAPDMRVKMPATAAGVKAIISNSGIDPAPRIQVPVDPEIIGALRRRFPEFVRAYEPDGMAEEEFAAFGSTAATLNQFLGGHAGLLETVRGFMIQVK